METLKSNVAARLQPLNDEIEKLLIRWNQFKPKNNFLDEDRNAMLAGIKFIQEKREEFDELQEKRNALLYAKNF